MPVLSRVFPRALGAALALAGVVQVCAGSETMGQRTLRQLLDRQKILLADAARAGDDKLGQDSVKVQMNQLLHEYELLIQSNPDFAPAYADYGYLLGKLHLRDKAMKVLLKADQLDPAIPMVKNQLGNALAEDGRPLEAIDYFEAAARLDPDEPLYPYQIGTLLYFGRDQFLGQGGYTRQEWDEKMHGAFKRAAELAPDRIEFTYRYAESFGDLAAPDWNEAYRAWDSLQQRVKTPLEHQTIELQEANVRLKQGRPDEARALLDQVSAAELAEQKQKLVAQLPENAKK